MGLTLGNRAVLRLSIGAPLVFSAFALSGCMGSPTYGTGTTANMQLLEDVTGIARVGDKKRDPIAYTPRPELVKPGADQQLELTAPQEAVAGSANPAWPESPEQRLARIKAEATANQGNPAYRAPVIMDSVDPNRTADITRLQTGREALGGPGYENGQGVSSEAQRKAFNERLKEKERGDPNVRKYLSEPPTTYRQAEASAATGDIGEDEWKKERRNKRNARKKGGGLGALWPF